MAEKNPITVGQRVGLLTVVCRYKDGTKNSKWECLCDCGETSRVRGNHLKNARIRSCGCLLRIISKAGHTKHGHTGHRGSSRTYKSWMSMRWRCLNSNCQSWLHYGGRGITICTRWMAFENFLEDMGERPTGTSLDRVNNDGNYEPGNCRWATPLQQANNQSFTRMIEFRGQIKPITEWAGIIGIPRSTLAERLYRKWPLERAMSGYERTPAKT